MRERERRAVDDQVRLHPNDWSSLEVRLVDCSETGFRAECEARVRAGDQVTLELPGFGPVRAYVAWCRGREFGARFAQPIAIQQAELRIAGDQQMLARLLVQRAAAQRSQKWEHEERLRRKIADALPLHRG